MQDINDNPPEFKEDYHPVVPENQPPEIFVIELAAYDKDDYGAGNGPPFKFSLAESATVDIKESFRLEFISSKYQCDSSLFHLSFLRCFLKYHLSF